MSALSHYETHYLSVLRAIVLSPGSKIQALADKTGIHPNSVLRYTAKLDQDGWIERRSVHPDEVPTRRRNLTPPYLCYPTSRVNKDLIHQALGKKLAEKRDHPVTQEFLRLLELTAGINPATAGFARIVRSIASMALDLAAMNQDMLPVEPVFDDFVCNQEKSSLDKK